MDIQLLKHQYRFMTSEKPITIMIAGRGTGKSFVAGMKIATLLLQGYSVIGIAQNYSMVKKVLLKAVEDALQLISAEYDKNISDMTIRVDKALFYGFSAENPEGPRGLTNVKALIIDEAALCPKEMYDIAVACLRGQGKPIVYLISTPRGRANWLSKMSEDHNNELINATTYDNTFLDSSFVKLLEDQYSEAFARQELLGEITDFEGEEQFFKTYIINQAKGMNAPDPFDKLCFGLDCARFGGDATCLVVRKGKNIADVLKEYKTDTFKIVSMVEQMERKHGKPYSIAIDCTGGYGAGAFDLLNINRKNVISCNFGGKSPNEFSNNFRTYIHDLALEYFNLGGKIGYLTELEEELLAQEYIINTSGKKQLKDKAIVKQKLGRSPDTSDAFCLSLVTRGDMIRDESNQTEIENALFNYRIKQISKKAGFSPGF